MVDVQELGERGDVVGRGAGLAVEDAGDGDFVAAERLCDGGESELFGGFGGEEGGGRGGEGDVCGGLGREKVVSYGGWLVGSDGRYSRPG